MREIRISDEIQIQELTPYLWEVVQYGDMRVPGRIYTDFLDHLDLPPYDE